jgi:predicted nucleic acid-binding protein
MVAFVVDSSIAAAWCFKDETTDYTEGVLNAVSGSGEGVAPRLLAYEIRNSIIMGLRRGRIVRADAEEYLKSIPDLRIRLIDPPSYDAIFNLADLHGLSFYDAAYLDLSLREKLPIATLDKALLRAAERSGVERFQP